MKWLVGLLIIVALVLGVMSLEREREPGPSSEELIEAAFAADVGDVFNLTGCDAVYIARGSLGKPWIFRDIDLYLKGKKPKDAPGLEDIKEISKEHLFDARYGEQRLLPPHIYWSMGENSNISAKSEQGDKGIFNLKIFKPRFSP